MVEVKDSPTPGARYRIVRYVDIFPDQATSARDAAKVGYESMLEADLVGELPIVEVTDIESGETVDIDLQDFVHELENDDRGAA